MASDARNRWNLFLCSFSILFVELALIRWIPAYIRAMGYFTNFVLLGSFLGIGLGILQARRRLDLLAFFPVSLAALVGVISVFKFELSIDTSQEYYFAMAKTGTESFLLLPLIFACVTLLFTLLAQNLGRLLAAVRPPLTAYTLDIAGSIAGTVLFALISFLGAPPAVWFAIGAVAVLALPQRRGMIRVLNAAILLGVVVWVGLVGRTSLWSPYYRIDTHPLPYHSTLVTVNNGINYQAMGPYAARQYFAYYRVPFQTFHFPPSARELIIGAGSGTDVDVGLHNGIHDVTAVELDPTIYNLGRRLNPDRPYQSAAVHVVIDDGRAFLERAHGTYDLIILAATDSLALSSSFANLRSESYLFTREAFEAARRHLSARGVLVLYNYYRRPWIVHKIAGMLAHVFGRAPYGRVYAASTSAAVLMDGPGLRALPPALYAAHRISPAPNVTDATDDWPFLYLKEHGVDTVYLQALGLAWLFAVGALALSVRRTELRRFDPTLFFTGLAFLLLEAKSIVNFMLLFGVTWLVNALVIAGILGTVLLANWINTATRLRLDIRLLYGGLAATLALNLLLPLHSLLALDLGLRYLLGCAVLFSPILLANLIFGRLFGDVVTPDIAFASNLLGAFVGGTLEYLSLQIGYHLLLLAVLAAYVLSFVAFAWRHGRGTARPAPTTVP
jgi:hypothetical protein